MECYKDIRLQIGELANLQRCQLREYTAEPSLTTRCYSALYA